ncbi:MAG: ABC transporter substrate-binding protein [Chloroflexaceae bacterium]|nr:ABC transporter substrate-binding protein [Chloroflexaceae bacterium]
MPRNVLLVMFLLLAGLSTTFCSSNPTPAPAGNPVTALPGSTTPTSPPPVAAGEPLVIGLLTDQTSATLGIYGPQQERGFRLGLEYATNGTMMVADRPIEIVMYDNGSDPEQAAKDAQRLIEDDGAEILIGTVSSSATVPVIDLAAEYDRILIIEPAASPLLTGEYFHENVFRTSRTSAQDALVVARTLSDMGSTFVQIAPDNTFGRGAAAGFYDAIRTEGGRFTVNDNDEDVGTIFIPLESNDFLPYLTNVIDSAADVLIVNWAGEGFVPLFRQVQELGIFDTMIVSTGMADNATLQGGYENAVGSIGQSVYHYTLPDNPINDWLVQRHQEDYGTPPDLFTAGGMAAAIMVVQSVESTGGDTSTAALIPLLEGIAFHGPNGRYQVRAEDHVMLQPLYLVRLTNVTDDEYRFFELISVLQTDYTAPPCLVSPELARCAP